MVYGLNQPQNTNLSYGAVKDVVPQDVANRLPQSVQNFDAQDTFESAAPVGMITSKSNDAKTTAMTVGIWGGFIGLRTLLDKVCAGDWNKSLFGRVSNLGDSIDAGFNKVTFGLSHKAGAGISNITNRAKNFLANKFDFAASLKTPLKFENPSAITQANGMAGRLFNDDIKNAITRCDDDVVTKVFGNIKEFKGLDAAGIREKFTQIGINPLGKENAEVVENIMKAFEKSGETFKISHFNFSVPFTNKTFKIPMTGKFNPLRIFQVKMPGSSIANKFRALAKTSGAKTALGKNMAYVFGSSTEGLTSCIVGGKLAPVIQAAVIANAIKKTMDAPEGERLSTFMDEMVPQAAFFMTMPYQAKLTAKLGGWLKYLGMGGQVDAAFLDKVKNSPELIQKLNLQGVDLTKALTKSQRQVINVEHFRDAVAQLNSKVKAGNISGVEYQKGIKNIKKLLNGNSKWYQKPFKFIGKFFGAGYQAETVMPLIKNNMTAAGAKVSGIKNIIKSKGAGTLRFVMGFFVISTLLNKPIKAITNKIFGKPYDAQAAEAEKAKQAQIEAMKNNPALNMTEEDMIRKLQAHPEVIQALQNDPKMMAEIEKNPALLVQILASLPDAPANTWSNTVNKAQSPLLQKYLNQGGSQQMQPQGGYAPNASYNYNNPGMQNGAAQTGYPQFAQPNNMTNPYNYNQQNMNMQQPAPKSAANTTQGAAQANAEDNIPEPPRSYIPSSKPYNFNAKGVQSGADTITNPNVQAMLSKADRAEAEAMKFLSI